MSGTTLLKQIAAATGLQTDSVQGELERLVTHVGKNSEDITLDELREILAAYLQDVLLAASKEFSE